jgi:hypothetical protein
MTTITDDERAAIDKVLAESWDTYEVEYRDDSGDGRVIYEDDEVVAMDFSQSDDRGIVYGDLEIDLPYRVFANVMVQRARECDPDHHWMYPLVFPKEVSD